MSKKTQNAALEPDQDARPAGALAAQLSRYAGRTQGYVSTIKRLDERDHLVPRNDWRNR